jgi:indolepyruvate ferredoxin oxidoreductase
MATVRAVLQDGADFEPFSEIADAVTGDAIATNMMMLGFAFQRGLIPLEAASILAAIELNGVAIEANRSAFAWGRMLAARPAEVHALTDAEEPSAPTTLDEIVAHRSAFLEDYQGKRLANRYRTLVGRVVDAARDHDPDGALALAVARNYFKLLAYKDEYEVARLYTDGEFARRLAEQFEGDFKLAVHLAPPLLARPDPDPGRPRKRRFGRWMLSAFRLLARLRFLRGTVLDPFGYSAERCEERLLIDDYEALIDDLLAGLDRERLADAVALASLPEQIRGFGPVKAAAIATAREREAVLRARFRQGPSPATRPAAA